MDTNDIISLGKKLEEKAKLDDQIRDLKFNKAQLEQTIRILGKERDDAKLNFQKEQQEYLKQINDIKKNAEILENARKEIFSQQANESRNLTDRKKKIEDDEMDLKRRKDVFLVKENNFAKANSEFSRKEVIISQISNLINQL